MLKEGKNMKKGIIAVLSAGIGIVAGIMGQGFLKNKIISEKTSKVDKFKNYYTMLNQWLLLKQEGKSLDKYFLDHNIGTIAIYGMGEMGNRLYDELKNTSIEIKYAIDNNADNTYSELEVVKPGDNLRDVDAIIVTSIFAFEEIEKELSRKNNMNIISLEDVVYEI